VKQKTQIILSTRLKLILHKLCACGLCITIKPLTLLCLFITVYAVGQDTVLLNLIEVRAKKIELASIGKKYETIDSILKQQFKFNSIVDVLSFNSPIYIKSYGPGALATTAFRGGNASQTAVLWNGLNIQNAMLGQADLALMPVILFNDIGVEYGGSSSLFGSGAIGGSIHLNNKNTFNTGFVTATNLGVGNFGLKNASTKILISKARFVSSTKVYTSYSENNFTYKDTLDKEQPIKQQKNAGYNFKGLMQEFNYLINSKQSISANAWINANNRRLPATNLTSDGKTYQYDAATRCNVNWDYTGAKLKSLLRAAVFIDRIDYTDSLTAIFSKSKTQTLIAENENYIPWKQHQLNVGVNFSSSTGVTNNYEGIKSLQRLSFLAGNKFSFLHGKFLMYVSGRAEYFSVGALPITGNLALEYHLFKNIIAKASINKVYRQPTLNELYWQPGGNINLKPEQGFAFDGELNYKKQYGHVLFFVSGAAYSRKIQDWILWTPGANGNPSPINVQQVWSRGSETSWRVHYQKNKMNLSIGFLTAYVVSTTELSRQENSNAVGKQLIYTPRYTANGNFSIGYDNWQLTYFHQYIGYRFTSTDNTQWLNPYYLASLRINYNLSVKQLHLALFSAANNLFNTNYAIILGKPMPLRNYEIGITLQTTSKTNNKP
jgi:vitamin B12 transporter